MKGLRYNLNLVCYKKLSKLEWEGKFTKITPIKKRPGCLWSRALKELDLYAQVRQKSVIFAIYFFDWHISKKFKKFLNFF